MVKFFLTSDFGEFMTTKNCWQKDFCIPSEPSAGHEVLDVILSQLSEFCWERKDIFAIHLALEEALINAIRHGNRSLQEKSVHIYVKVSPEHFMARIKDEGSGFDPEHLPDPTHEEFCERPCGRGVKLMQNFMTSVSYNPLGNEVTLEKISSKQESSYKE
ncbi:MAG: ATP-binding protein [Planctomycetia bacterium]|nr:ATP-binding protein [Planctomycetia bacterium]